jgi:hypothetical protein
MSVLLAILGAVSAVFKGLGILAQSLYYRRAKDAGKTEAELAVQRRANQNIRTAHEIEDRNRAATADELERLLD